jgi:hypothetical protein
MWRIHTGESAQAQDDGSPAAGIDSAVKGPHGLWIRYPSDLEAVCFPVSSNSPPMLTAQVRVLWVDGCCLSCRDSISAGSEFWCRILSRGRPLTKMIRLHVNQVTREDHDRTFATCGFDHSLTHKDCCILL